MSDDVREMFVVSLATLCGNPARQSNPLDGVAESTARRMTSFVATCTRKVSLLFS